MFVKDITQALETEKFESWLNSKDAEAIVGEATRKDCCPLACYLKETGAAAVDIWVTADQVQTVHTYQGFNIGEAIVWLPEWARDFVAAIDEAEEGQKITATSAKNVLGMVLAPDPDKLIDFDDIPF